LTPDKRTVSVFKEHELADALRKAVAMAVFERLEMTPTIEGPSQSLLPFTAAVSKETELEPPEAVEPNEDNLGGLAEAVEEPSHSACPCHVVPSLAEPIADSLSREDLLSMEVIGQFNCGFILTRLARSESTSSTLLYIVDQHAADERFRLETLERSEKATAQCLLMPKRFFLSAPDALFVQAHLEELAKIGFEVNSLPESGSFELRSVPQMTGVTLDLPDLLEVIHDWQGPEGALLRADRIAAALASKACRSAVMIGAPLALPQMSTIVRNLAGLQKPWICAHGRPTVRLLYSERT
jgi:DNA mismatch repair ATPase MutL